MHNQLSYFLGPAHFVACRFRKVPHFMRCNEHISPDARTVSTRIVRCSTNGRQAREQGSLLAAAFIPIMFAVDGTGSELKDTNGTYRRAGDRKS